MTTLSLADARANLSRIIETVDILSRANEVRAAMIAQGGIPG